MRDVIRSMLSIKRKYTNINNLNINWKIKYVSHFLLSYKTTDLYLPAISVLMGLGCINVVIIKSIITIYIYFYYFISVSLKLSGGKI